MAAVTDVFRDEVSAFSVDMSQFLSNIEEYKHLSILPSYSFVSMVCDDRKKSVWIMHSNGMRIIHNTGYMF